MRHLVRRVLALTLLTACPGASEPPQACVDAAEQICAAACACGDCDILGVRPGISVRVESDDEASCTEAYIEDCVASERPEDELAACAEAYATAECSEGAVIQPEICVEG